MSWESLIGLEIHVQLNTRSKLFSAAPNRFGDPPNTNISVSCTGQPGSLPVLNREAVRKAVQFGLAVHAEINPVSRFDRKSYFYPDLPKGFQITQFERPLLLGGAISATVEGKEKLFQIRKALLEEDAGMLKHYPSFTGVDFNRAGTPLLEIVSEPCMASPKEASAYAFAIRTLLIYLNTSECNLEEGSFRIDANVSVRKQGESLYRSKVEIKNLNSFSFLEMAIDQEIRRQIRIYEGHSPLSHEELILPATGRWDHEKKEIVLMRKKSGEDDYRYVPEPDLAPIILSTDYVDWVRHTLPELPEERRRRYIADLALHPQIASILINHKPLSDYFEEALKHSTNPQALSLWICNECAGHPLFSIPPAYLAKLVRMLDEKKITGPIAKSLLSEMIRSPKTNPEMLVQNNPDYQPIQSEEELAPLIEQTLAAHPQAVLDFKAGKPKAFDFLIGQVMEASHGKAAPQATRELLLKKIKGQI